MPPTVALIVWLVLLLALFRLDPGKSSGSSLALWVPLIWIFIVGSRLPSQWLGLRVGSANQALENGNPLDRTVFFLLIVLAIAVLLVRGFNWLGFFGRNIFLGIFGLCTGERSVVGLPIRVIQAVVQRSRQLPGHSGGRF